MKFLIDTCVISELIRKMPDRKVIKWISDKNEDDLFISVLTLGELRKGIAKISDLKKKKELDEWFLKLEKRFSDRIIFVDKEIAEKWGFIQGNPEKVGNPMSPIDALISCTALTKGLTVVTRNVKDMDRKVVLSC